MEGQLMNPLAIKGLVVLAIVVVLFGAGYKAGGNAVKASNLAELQAQVKADEAARTKLKAEYEAKLKSAQDSLIKITKQKQKTQIKWKVKHDKINIDRNRNNVLCYDNQRMQRQKERVTDTNEAAKAIWHDATTPANQPTH